MQLTLNGLEAGREVGVLQVSGRFDPEKLIVPLGAGAPEGWVMVATKLKVLPTGGCETGLIVSAGIPEYWTRTEPEFVLPL